MKVNLICRTHPRYKVKRRPKGNCEACWFLYYLKIQGVYIFDKDFSEVRIDEGNTNHNYADGVR